MVVELLLDLAIGKETAVDPGRLSGAILPFVDQGPLLVPEGVGPFPEALRVVGGAFGGSRFPEEADLSMEFACGKGDLALGGCILIEVLLSPLPLSIFKSLDADEGPICGVKVGLADPLPFAVPRFGEGLALIGIHHRGAMELAVQIKHLGAHSPLIGVEAALAMAAPICYEVGGAQSPPRGRPL